MVNNLKIDKILNDRKYIECIYELINDKILSLENFSHHKKTTRLRHSLKVSYLNYRICTFLKLDARSAARAGLLHDLFFYETKSYNKKLYGKNHFRQHPKTALQNAVSMFEINQTEQDIILHHMWPATISLPQSPEGIVTMLVDKYCTLTDIFDMFKKNSRL